MREFSDGTVMPFGKHKGKTLENVPASYLLWLFGEMEKDKAQQGPLFRYIKKNLKVLEQEAAEEQDDE